MQKAAYGAKEDTLQTLRWREHVYCGVGMVPHVKLTETNL